MIEQLTDFPSNVIAFVCKGRVTKADYEAVLVPAMLNALRTHDKVRLYCETGPDFAGIDPGAMWEDFKVGTEHLTRWERVALVPDIEWIKQTVRLWGFLMPALTRVFSTSEAAQAREWIAVPGGRPSRGHMGDWADQLSMVGILQSVSASGGT